VWYKFQSVVMVVGWSVHLSVITTESCAKTSESIEMPFVKWTRGSPRNHLLGGGLEPRMRRGTFGDYTRECWVMPAVDIINLIL